MTRFAALVVLGVIALAGAASADPIYGNSLRLLAQAGSITPHGVFDGR